MDQLRRNSPRTLRRNARMSLWIYVVVSYTLSSSCFILQLTLEIIDYIGNTIVQRIFENCSHETKQVLLEKISPYLPSIGIHKNGTWAAQKIIDHSTLPAQVCQIQRCFKLDRLTLDRTGENDPRKYRAVYTNVTAGSIWKLRGAMLFTYGNRQKSICLRCYRG